ncbi:translocation/assembly module TamB domain-containing protein [Massilibacteroides sp.]|uniref:translocation/assembly module TamB domain-containing protein n=1 Tax=Massilibacteroides sp. TaxID=2034766 RepID=UPI00260CE7D8|nr:translocation/assembly module TamB domain-containing protein [Massilibacteroides sp.]MDD4515614.1 translocation/assembly module TamB domain-containing protein [Massilibacteroides sp.]
MQFLIDAFSSKDSIKKKPNFDIRLQSVLLRRGNLSYDVFSESQTRKKFNKNHIAIENLSASISVKALTENTLKAQIKKLSFDEHSGLSLNKLSLHVQADKDSAFINDLRVKLPGTDFKIPEAKIDLANINSMEELVNNAPITLTIDPSQIRLSDLKAFVPAFTNFKDIIDVSAEASGYINNINLKRLSLNYSNKAQFVGRMELKGITTPEEAYLFGQVNKMQITNEGLSGIVNNFSEKAVELPDQLKKLGSLHFAGEISGFLDNLIAYGKLTSAIGTLETDLNFGHNKEQQVGTFIKGHIGSSDLEISRLFDEGNPYGKARFNITLDAIRPINGDFSGLIEAKILNIDYLGYNYKNLLFSGDFKKNGFNGKINIDDPNGSLHAEGTFIHQGKNSLFNFTAKAKDIRPDVLNLTPKYENPNLSFSMNADFTGNTIDNIEGEIRIDSLSFVTAPSQFSLDKLLITASGHTSDRKLQIQSDILNGEVNGAYSFATIIPEFISTLQKHIPSLVKTKQSRHRETEENNFSVLLTVENTEALSKTLKLPITILTQTRITGFYNNLYDKFQIEAYMPKFSMDKTIFESGYLICSNQSGQIDLNLKIINHKKQEVRNYFDLQADANEDKINTLFTWANNKENKYRASFRTSTVFTEEKDQQGSLSKRVETSITPEYLMINDSTWQVLPSVVSVENGRISIDNFYASHGDEHLLIDGTISKDPNDILLLDLKDIELSYIFNTVNIEVLRFGGKATGTVNVQDVFNSRMLNTDLEIKNFSFNQVELGQLNLFSEWDDTQQGILMLGTIYKNDSTWTDVNGYIYPVGEKAGLSLYFDANDINLAFLQPFMENITSTVEGHGFGLVRLYGSFKNISVEGNAFVKDGRIGIDFLNTQYTFSDSLFLTKNNIRAKGLTIEDKYGNKGQVTLDIAHEHFRNFKFSADVNANNMLVYDVAEKQNPMIFGSVFGTGSTKIAGNEKVINFDINMQSAPKTALSFNFMSGSKATEYDFITFIDKKKLAEQAVLATTDSSSTNENNETTDLDDGTEIKMNMLLDITPDANIELVMDPVAGDKLKATGSGSMQIEYGTKSDLRMYGGVNINSGSYNFSLQQLIHKGFKIGEGSTVDFRGDPFDAVMDINAIYNLTANIGDLDPSLIEQSGRANIPVNCILQIDGQLRNPMVKFDIELPGSNAELERLVKGLVDTDEMMTLQIIYLLVLNKFYTPSYMGDNSNELNAVASSALSSQLSGILNSLTDKVQIGTNIRTSQDGVSDTEFEMLLSSQLLDNRLLFNGNFGVRNNPYQNQESTFIGEFDLEYKLTPTGEIRLKAYNHANDMYRYQRQSLTTQGLGIMYRKDFTNFSEIFRSKKRFPLPAPVLKTDSAATIREEKENLIQSGE